MRPQRDHMQSRFPQGDTSTLQVSSTAQSSYLDSPFLDPFAVDDVGTAPPPREGTGQVAVITDLQCLPTVKVLLP